MTLKSHLLIYFILFCFSEFSFALESANCRQSDLFPSQLLNVKHQSNSGLGKFQFKTHVDGHQLNAHFYLPSRQNAESPVIFVMHGAKRNADSYLKNFAPIAERHNAIAIAPEFSKKFYPKSIHYTLGVGKNKPVSGRKYRSEQWLEPYEYLYNEIEHLFEGIKQKLNLDACGYYLYGHSAGGQFIHRMLTFAPNSRVIKAVAANSGWYTLTDAGNGKDKNYSMPYGIQGSPIDDKSLAKTFAHNLTVLVGENDTKTAKEDKYVRKTKEALFQGENRYQRAINYFKIAKNKANELSTDFNWRLEVVPKANHSTRKMALSAAWFLNHKKSDQACISSPKEAGKSLLITEILADPPKTKKGDANNDGTRDSQEDEFIEIVNTGKKNICLSGWTLGDHDKKRRHVFPSGTQLRPGKALVVFGGGIPRGGFGSAQIQWATFSSKLSLSNKGDGIMIHDNFGALVKHISWGNCAKQKCAAEHIKQSLDLGQSIVRSPKNKKKWLPHSKLSKKLFSPGVKSNGKPY